MRNYLLILTTAIGLLCGLANISLAQLYGGNNAVFVGSQTVASLGCTDTNGSTDDTSCVQAAINAAEAGGFTLFFDAAHLYKITSPLVIATPADLEGPYRYGIWAVNQPTGSGPKTCTWGLVTPNTGITMIKAQAITGTIHGICIDMTGNDTLNPTSGAAINVTPPDANHYSSGWDIQYNTILQPNDGVAGYGNGVINVCCGIGTTADGDVWSHNTIISPTHAAISIGQNHATTTGGPGTVGITVDDNNIVCKTATSKANAYGVVIYEGAISYNGTQNGPEGCNIGVAVIPGTISGTPQVAQFDGDGVFGDQSTSYNLLVRPNGGAIEPLFVGGKEAWANSSIPGNASVLIDCTGASTCEEFTITNLLSDANGSGGIGLDVEGGANGPYDLTIANSVFCKQASSSVSTTALKLNAGSGSTGRWIIANNRFGTGCFGGNNSGSDVGINLTVNSGSSSKGSITITGNDLSSVTRPISYTPSVNDKVIIKNNMGIDTDIGNGGAQPITSASTITLFDAFPSYFIAGNTPISTINGAWQGRDVDFYSTANSIDLATGGNICSPTSAAYVHLRWAPTGTCWEVIGGGGGRLFWAPTVLSSGGTSLPTAQVGAYSVNGSQVNVDFYVTISGWTGSPAGYLEIGGLPIAPVSVTNQYGECFITNWSGITFTDTAFTQLTGTITAGQNLISLASAGSGRNTSLLGAVNITSLSGPMTFAGSCHYYVQ